MPKTKKPIPLEESEQLDAFIDHLVRTGFLGDVKITDEEKRKSKKKATKSTFHSTELLLEKYRVISWTLQYYPQSTCDELDIPYESVDDIMDALSIESVRGNKKVDNRLQNYTPTRYRMDRVNDAISFLKTIPKTGKNMYNVIYLRYIDADELSVEDICKKLNISPTTYKRLRKEAIEFISTRLWGINDKKTAMMFEAVELLADLSDS